MTASRFPDFTTTPFAPSRMDRAESGETWETAEGIGIKQSYDAADRDGLETLQSWPGVAALHCAAPTRRCTSTKPVDDPAVRGFLHRRGDSNAFYRAQPGGRPEAGCRSPSIWRRTAAMTRTTRGSAAMSAWPVSPIDSILDMRTLFDGIPLDRDERVDDDERRGAAGARALHRRGRGAGV
jgi:methylmalonyl-CoA mutase